MSYLGISEPLKSLGTDVPTLVALLVCLIPTTIGALLAAIGIAGMDRALQANIIAKSGKAVETAGDIDTVLLDKTGTITVGNRHATEFEPVGTYSQLKLALLAALASTSDETPEGKSIVRAAQALGVGAKELIAPTRHRVYRIQCADADERCRFARRDLYSQRRADAVIAFVLTKNGDIPARLQQTVDSSRVERRHAACLSQTAPRSLAWWFSRIF